MGYLYNALSLDSIHLFRSETRRGSLCVQNVNPNPHQIGELQLVDFKNMTRYTDKIKDANGEQRWEHRECVEVENIVSSLHNASIEVMNFKSPSRRDDLKMLCYMLCSLLRKNCLDKDDTELSL